MFPSLFTQVCNTVNENKCETTYETVNEQECNTVNEQVFFLPPPPELY